MLADFTIHIHDGRKPMAVQVKVHDHVAALRGASKKNAKKWQMKDDDFSETLGICHRQHIDGDPVVALVRLAPPDIGIGIVSHELTHAAVAIWDVEHEFKDVPLTCANDEWFCWILGELVRQTVNQFYEKGIYPS